MPKSRAPSRSKQPRAETASEHPPVQADVERAIESVLDRLRPKARRPSETPPAKDDPRDAAEAGRAGKPPRKAP